MRPTLHIALQLVALGPRTGPASGAALPESGSEDREKASSGTLVTNRRWALDLAPERSGAERREKTEGRVRVPETRAEAAPTPGENPSRGRFLTPALLASLVLLNLVGAPYYLLSLPERIRSPLHPWFKPSGYVGQSAGILAFILFCFLWLYPLRKKLRWLSFTGALSRWLDLHVLAGLAIPLLGAAHASWRFEGLIGLGYAAMLTVCVSGVIGRYLYTHIPRGRSGLELGIREIHERREALLARMSSRSGLDERFIRRCLSVEAEAAEDLGPVGALLRMFTDDLRRWKAARSLRRHLQQSMARGRRMSRAALAEIVRLARRELALRQQVRMIDATQRVFRYWHIAHRPFAVTALLAVLLHVAIVAYLGVTWFR